MKLWRLIRLGHIALDGAGTVRHGGRYSPPGVPVVNFASEAGLAVLVAMRYLPSDPAEFPDDYVLGWTEVDALPARVPAENSEEVIRAFVAREPVRDMVDPFAAGKVPTVKEPIGRENQR